MRFCVAAADGVQCLSLHLSTTTSTRPRVITRHHSAGSRRAHRLRHITFAGGPNVQEAKTESELKPELPADDSEAPAVQLKLQRQQQSKRKGKGRKSSGKTVSLNVRRTPEEAVEEAEAFKLDDINPIAIGKRSRQAFDDVWQQFARLSSPGQSGRNYSDFQSPAEEFSSPTAVDTTVLVAGATGRVGRILVRKLLLRGYKVKALVRGRDQEAVAAIPQSVEVFEGDIGDYDACYKAMKGCNKVICAVTARSSLTGDVRRVEELGVKNLAIAYMNHLNEEACRSTEIMCARPSRVAKVDMVDFRNQAARDAWGITQVGIPRDAGSNTSRVFDRGQDIATANKNKWRDAVVFTGAVYSRGGRAEISGPVQLAADRSIVGSEGLVLRLGADGNQYTFTLTTGSGHSYATRITTRRGFMTARLPFSVFRAEGDDFPELLPEDVASMSMRFEKRSTLARVGDANASNPNDFRLELDWIRALPGGTEADFVLVSCGGAGLTDSTRRKVVAAKRRGEDILRASGLGYTVVRPGPLLEEPGGYKALVFDQGNRIAQTISCADAADVALKALHDGAARNKTFEVCSEVTSAEGVSDYELVAHLPDRSNNYLTPALAGLEKNT